MDYSNEIKDGIAVITGASTGLGREMARSLAQQGVRVAALARSGDALNILAAECTADMIQPIRVDIGDPDAVARAFSEVRKKGRPTILVNNAAVYPHRDILNETPSSFMETMQINLGGMVACTHEVLKDMVDLGYGRILNVTTFAGNAPAPTAAAYSVSKGATRIFTAALQADLKDRFPDIVINEWIPGSLKTAMGVPDGIEPKQAAAWGVRLALLHDRRLNGLSFARDRSILTQQGWKRRLLNRVLGQRPRVELLS